LIGYSVFCTDFYGYSLGIAVPAIPEPLRPTADPGGDRVVYNEVGLDGSASTTPNDSITSWHWELVNRYDDALNRSADGVTATINGLSFGIYDVSLTVTDSTGATDSSSFMLVAIGPYDVNGDGKQGLAESIDILRSLVTP
jgi:hypothetical protein